MKMKFIDVKEDLMSKELYFSMTRGEKEMFINCERNKYECFGLTPGEIYEVSKYDDPEGLYDAYIEFDDFRTIAVNTCFFTDDIESKPHSVEIPLEDFLVIHKQMTLLDVLSQIVDSYNKEPFDNSEEALEYLTDLINGFMDRIQEDFNERVDTWDINGYGVLGDTKVTLVKED